MIQVSVEISEVTSVVRYGEKAKLEVVTHIVIDKEMEDKVC